jgi:hypothetical protein
MTARTASRLSMPVAATSFANHLPRSGPEKETGMNSTAIADITAERERQISFEGWSPDHDDAHGEGQIAFAAACYSLSHYFSKPHSELLERLWALGICVVEADRPPPRFGQGWRPHRCRDRSA